MFLNQEQYHITQLSVKKIKRNRHITFTTFPVSNVILVYMEQDSPISILTYITIAELKNKR